MTNTKRKRSGKFYSNNEKKVMEKLGFKPTKASGSGWIEKEDGESEEILVQLKSTDANSFKVDMLDMKKLEYHADLSHKLPLFVVQFLSSNDLYFVVSPESLQEVAEYLKGEESGLKRKLEPCESMDIEEEIEKPNKKIIKSSNRKSFWNQYEKERVKKYGNAKDKNVK